MKFNRSIIGFSAAIAMMAVLAGCGKSAVATDPAEVLDTTPPQAVSGISMLSVPLSGKHMIIWEPSTAPDLAGYEVYGVDGGNYRQIGTSNDARYELQDLNVATSIAIRAFDISGNRSPYALYTIGDTSEDL